jgi:hypothetical protein
MSCVVDLGLPDTCTALKHTKKAEINEYCLDSSFSFDIDRIKELPTRAAATTMINQSGVVSAKEKVTDAAPTQNNNGDPIGKHVTCSILFVIGSVVGLGVGERETYCCHSLLLSVRPSHAMLVYYRGYMRQW